MGYRKDLNGKNDFWGFYYIFFTILKEIENAKEQLSHYWVRS